MNAIFTAGLLALAVSTSISANSSLDDPCASRVVIQSQTEFPIRSQLRGHKGTVFINVTLDESGRATSAAVQRSSGHVGLDRAATRSVLNKWQFDVTRCDHQDWPAIHQVAVEYRNDEYQ